MNESQDETTIVDYMTNLESLGVSAEMRLALQREIVEHNQRVQRQLQDALICGGNLQFTHNTGVNTPKDNEEPT